jgi:D-alanyl-D-alanine dipeptidase
MKELGSDNAGNHPTDFTWQCWMVNTKTGEEKLIAHGHSSQEECKREATDIFAQWEIDPYPSSEGWQAVYRQDSPLKMAKYWRDYYQDLTRFWSDRYQEVLHIGNQDNQQLPHLEQQQRLDGGQQEKPARRRRVKIGALKALESRYKRSVDTALSVGAIFAGTIICAITFEVVAFIKQPPKDRRYIAQHISDIPLSIRELFGNKKGPGSIAVGVAEGNLTPSGKPTSIYLGHTDPGNFATNKGFCSWNKSQGLSVAEADQRCLKALQWQSVATENRLLDLGLAPEGNKAAIVMGTDLWNQSNSAGPLFPFKYKAAKDQGLKGRQAYIWARVEAFRNEQQELDASGLFGICKRESYYRQQLTGLKVDSEAWRWNCIKLDQMRRIVEIEKVLKSGSFGLG